MYREVVARFIESAAPRPALGLVYGRRRIGKSTLLVQEVEQRGGFYFEATRGSSRLHLDRLGLALGEHLGVGRMAVDTWDDAVRSLLALGARAPLPIVIDEFGHILAAEPTVDSVLATAFGPGARRSATSQARVILCGSAISVMRHLTAGQAALRGRVGMELLMYPDDFRTAATRLPDPDDLHTAVQVYCAIGGVVGYATDMVNFDLPEGTHDVDRWIVQRLLASGATLRQEGATLLAEDPAMSGAGSVLSHSILAAIANGAVSAGSIARRVGRPVSNLAATLNRLVEAGFVVRSEDPIRDQRPLYSLEDPFLQFHFAVIEPHGAALRDRAAEELWAKRLRATFDAQVRGPVFESMARVWARRFASEATLPAGSLIGSSGVSIDGVDHQLDLVVATPGPAPSQRQIHALGEAKVGATLGITHLQRLETARAALGARATDARLMLFGTAVDPALRALSTRRSDVEIVDLERLYRGD